MKQPVGAVLVLGALWMGYQAFDEWRMLNSMGVGADFIAMVGGPSKQDAIVKRGHLHRCFGDRDWFLE